MSMEAVAARAGVGKATLYRWWPTRASLAVEAFFESTRDALVFPETGSVREDFRVQIHALAALIRSHAGAALAGMLTGSRSDPELARALAERWVKPRRTWGEQKMREAGISDSSGALLALYSPLYSALMFGRPPLSEAEVEAYLAVVLRGIFDLG